MAKERVIPEFEGLERPVPGPDRSMEWWNDPDQPPSRSQRHVKGKNRSQEQPKWPMVALLVSIVIAVVVVLIVFLDMRKGSFVGSPGPGSVTTVTSPRLAGTSPDTVKAKLEKAGFRVEPLTTTSDPQHLGYDAAKTFINDQAATIVVFKDRSTAKAFAGLSLRARYVTVVGTTWAISFGQTEDLSIKQLAEEISIKGIGHPQWAPEGE